MNATQKPAKYELVDTKTGKVVASFAKSASAYRSADRRDAAYGAVRYIVRPVWYEADSSVQAVVGGAL